MGLKYSTVTVTSYNASPPADDGTQVSSNQVEWAKHKTKLGDPLKTAIEAVDSKLSTALNQDAVAKGDDYTITTAEHDKTVDVTTVSAGVNIYLPDASSAATGFICTVLNNPTSSDSLVVNLATDTDSMSGESNGVITMPVGSSVTFIVSPGEDGFNIKSSANIYISPQNFTRTVWPAGMIMPYGGSTAPFGWLACDGAEVDRTTYADLFTAISTAWGVGDGSTTFNLPKFNGLSLVGEGSGVTSEDVTAGAVSTSAGVNSAGAFIVVSNADKWVTGMAVTLTSGTSLPSGVSSGVTYYTIRSGSTEVQMASTLANAQNGVPLELGNTGVGVHTIVYAYSARTLGDYGGKETHAMSSTEHLLHAHSQSAHLHTQTAGNDSGATYESISDAPNATSLHAANTNTGSAQPAIENTGGNAAMNIMNPYAVCKFIISF